MKAQTKGQVKGLTIQSQAKTHETLGNTSVPTPLPVQFVLMFPPAGTNMMVRLVASPWSQHAKSVSPSSQAAPVRRMKEAALTNCTSKPILDEIEVKYQCALAQRCAAGLQFPSLTTTVTSSILLHKMNVSGLMQQTKAAGYQSAGVTSVAASHLGCLSSTGPMAHEDSSQSVLGKPGSAS